MSVHNPWRRHALLATVAAAALTFAATADAQVFTFMGPGDLISGSGSGRVDSENYAPGMRFPMESGPAYANSQVYNPGGYLGPGGGQCDSFNYSYPWRDNYCEIRQWNMPLCPAGNGHQGQDIRAATCEIDKHWGVSSADGTVTNVGNYSVYVTTPDGVRYDHLHMSNVQVSVGQSVTRGQRLGLISNKFGGTATSIHLHFNIRRYVDGIGTVYVPTYMALVNSYQALQGGQFAGKVEQVDCNRIVGWAANLSDTELPLNVTLGLQIEAGELLATFPADDYRGDLCENLSFCEHGFAVPSPLGLYDGQPHDIAAYFGDDADAGSLSDSPAVLQCEPWELEGLRRPVSDEAVVAWGFSAVWDELPAPGAEVDALTKSDDWLSEPALVSNEQGDRFWLLEDGRVRFIPDRATARAWRFDLDSAQVLDQATLADYPSGYEVLPRPVLVRGSDGQRYVLDHEGGGLFGLATGVTAAVGASGGPSGGGIPQGGLPGENGDCNCRAAGQRSSAPRNSGDWGWLSLLAAVAVAGARRVTSRDTNS